jgi:HEPN domain-containing protein
MNQARRDLNTARGLPEHGSFGRSCFAAQQAAEKAAKAVIQELNAVAWIRSVHGPLSILAKGVEVDKGFLDSAKAIDKYYISTGYPNSLDSGSPYGCFTGEDGESATVCGRRIAGFCEGIMA